MERGFVILQPAQNVAFDPIEFDTDKKLCYREAGTDAYFLLSRRGDAIEIHCAATSRAGAKVLYDSGRSIVKEISIIFPWCKMLIAPVKKRSVLKLCLKLGFTDLGIMDYGRDKSRVMVIDYGRCD